ncbi:hypothetical protein [uncultured Amphritea sp.]|nr:hypothetical protein [uncultured Amphritea sp.]
MLKHHLEAGRVVPEFNPDHIRELIYSPFRSGCITADGMCFQI